MYPATGQTISYPINLYSHLEMVTKAWKNG